MRETNIRHRLIWFYQNRRLTWRNWKWSWVYGAITGSGAADTWGRSRCGWEWHDSGLLLVWAESQCQVHVPFCFLQNLRSVIMASPKKRLNCVLGEWSRDLWRTEHFLLIYLNKHLLLHGGPTGTVGHFSFVHGLSFHTALALKTEHDLFPHLHAFSTAICHLLAHPEVHAHKGKQSVSRMPLTLEEPRG